MLRVASRGSLCVRVLASQDAQRSAIAAAYPHATIKPPVIIEKPAPAPVIIREVQTVVQLAPAAPAPQPVLSQPSASAPVAPAGVTRIKIRNGRLTALAPKGADLVRILVAHYGGVIRRMTVHVNDDGHVIHARLARKPRRYTVQPRAGNEQGDLVALGLTATRTFRVR
jgi:hypothetical protein